VPPDAGRILLPLARSAIAAAVGAYAVAAEHAPWLDQPGASFVTLMEKEKLRGCIGSLEPRRSLGEDVRTNAVAAALRDPRFPALTARELNEVKIEVSVLSAIEPITFHDEADAVAQLTPGVDGVIFVYGYHRSTFLPQVWDEFKDPRIFMGHLKHKAGLPPDFWRDAVVFTGCGAAGPARTGSARHRNRVSHPEIRDGPQWNHTRRRDAR